jgi:hypothetical protein
MRRIATIVCRVVVAVAVVADPRRNASSRAGSFCRKARE